MANTRAIVKRRKAIRNIRKITRTMELIATARFKKAMDRAVQADAYTQRISQMVRKLSASGSAAQHPLLEERPEPKRTLLLVLSSNRGLCGGYNANVLRVAVQAYDTLTQSQEVDLEIAGKRGFAFFRYRGVAPTKSYFHFEDKPTFDEVEVLADRYLQLFMDGQIDRLQVAYTRFVSMGKQEAIVSTLLPMSQLDTGDEEQGAGQSVDYDFYPSPGDILNEIVPVSFKVRLFKCFLDAAVSEQIARMVAMKGATENAGNLIKTLTMQYNRARQGQITSELAEIIGTAEALK